MSTTPLRALRSRMATLNTAIASTLPKARQDVYHTEQWKAARHEALRLARRACVACGRSACRLFVDHVTEIKDGGPAYEQSNLQVLCGACHTAKTVRTRAQRHSRR